MKRMKQRIKMPEKFARDPTRLFKEAVSGAIDRHNGNDDVVDMNTDPEILQSLMGMNQRRSALMTKMHKRFGIPQDEFDLADNLHSFKLDSSKA
jgi:hypothetical protein